MRDFKAEIDRCSDPAVLIEILDALAAEIEHAYEDETLERGAHDLEVLMRYGEYKLEKLMS